MTNVLLLPQQLAAGATRACGGCVRDDRRTPRRRPHARGVGHAASAVRGASGRPARGRRLDPRLRPLARSGTYEDRRAATVAEANAIGTTYLRAQLIAEPTRSQSLDLLRRYTNLALDITNEVPSSRAMHRTTGAEGLLQRQLRRLAGQAMAAAPVASAARLYVDSLNSTFDQQDVRLSALNNRVPSPVLGIEVVGSAVAVGLLAMDISILGRGLVPMLVAAMLVTLLLLVTFDLDRPTRGLITVPSTQLQAVRASMALPPAATSAVACKASVRWHAVAPSTEPLTAARSAWAARARSLAEHGRSQ